jgi:hypothetical protein
VRPVRRLAAFGAEVEVIVDAVAEGLFDFSEGCTLEGDYVTKPADTTEENAFIGFDSAKISFVFEHRRHFSSGVTPAAKTRPNVRRWWQFTAS